MTEYRISITTGNQNFYPDPCPELARILRRLATDIEEGGTGRPGEGLNLRDVNGNKVGTATWK